MMHQHMESGDLAARQLSNLRRSYLAVPSQLLAVRLSLLSAEWPAARQQAGPPTARPPAVRQAPLAQQPRAAG